MHFLNAFLTAGLVVWCAMSALWVLSLVVKDAGIVDIFWGAGFVIVAWVYFALTPDGYPPRKLLVAGLVTVWGLRLTAHIGLRNLGKSEDFRYREWRREHGGRWWWRSYLQVFMLQGIILVLVSAPLLAAQTGSAPARLTFLDALAVPVWLIGFIFEALGDYQLMRFKGDPANRGKLLTSGVWRYTRHPNYFGDAAQWWGFYLFALAAGGWWTLFSPLLMTFLLVRVSGVAMLERSLAERKPGYAAYMQTTNAFIPWFPKQRKGSS